MSDGDGSRRATEVLRKAARGGQERFLIGLDDAADRQRIAQALSSEGFVQEVGSISEALVRLADESFDLAILEVSPVPFVPPPAGATGDLAFRIWQLDREVQRDRFRRLGVPVTAWSAEEPLEGAVQEVQAFRRYARLARV